KPEDLAAILINTYGMTQANLDAVCDRTLPSAEKAGVWLDEGLTAFSNPIEAPDIDITGMSLVPFGETALPKLPTVLSKDVRPILIPAKARETITVKELWYCRGGNIVWKDSQGVVLETIDTRDGSCVRDVQFNAPKDDTYQLSCSDQCNMDVVSHGASYLVKPGMNKRLLGAGSMYFYVPEGSAGLIIGAKPYADTYITTVKLYDDTDSLQLNKSCTGGGACEWGMTNPSPGVWRVDYGGTYGGEGTYLWLRGVPPLMWHDPQYLLIPSSSPPPSLPISSGGGFSLFSLPRHYLFQDEDNTLEVQGASFDTAKTFTIKFFQAEVEQKSISVIPADSATLRTTLSVADLSSLSPGLYDMAVESTLDSTTKTYSTKIAITKRGDLWSQGATDSSLQKRDGKVDIYDVSRMLSKWGSTQATDLQEADINAGPNNVSANKIDLYDANKMMANWTG
ncbi:hypothetical protein KKI17_02050, partial [Patescibacteria group bacterium]|nr:hypothetical protein [Patescibacteria group bacterium]